MAPEGPAPRSGATGVARDVSRSLCSLNDEQLQTRRERVRTEILPLVEQAERIEGGFAVELGATAQARARLEALVALERRCCSSVEWTVLELAGRGRLRLEVRGLEPGSAILASLVPPPRTGSQTGG